MAAPDFQPFSALMEVAGEGKEHFNEELFCSGKYFYSECKKSIIMQDLRLKVGIPERKIA